jgi:hypothetical protein
MRSPLTVANRSWGARGGGCAPLTTVAAVSNARHTRTRMGHSLRPRFHLTVSALKFTPGWPIFPERLPLNPPSVGVEV